MIWQKGDLVYIPSNTRLSKFNWDSMDIDVDGQPMSMGVDWQEKLDEPSHAIVLDKQSVLNMRRLFIPNRGFWYVDMKDIYEPRRKQNGEATRSCARERDAHRRARQACCA